MKQLDELIDWFEVLLVELQLLVGVDEELIQELELLQERLELEEEKIELELLDLLHWLTDWELELQLDMEDKLEKQLVLELEPLVVEIRCAQQEQQDWLEHLELVLEVQLDLLDWKLEIEHVELQDWLENDEMVQEEVEEPTIRYVNIALLNSNWFLGMCSKNLTPESINTKLEPTNGTDLSFACLLQL